MKLISFNCTIELSKDENGYSNNYYVNIDENGVSVSNPYTRIIPEEAVFVTELIRDFIGMSVNYNARVDSFNRDMRLEQYAPQVTTTEETSSEVSTDTTEESTLPQEARGGSDTTDDGQPLTMETARDDEEKLKAMIASGLKEELETRETSSDMD